MRWGWIATAAAVLAALWVTARPERDVLAATLRATEAATAWHAVVEMSDGRSQNGRRETWVVLGLGSYDQQETDNNLVTVTVDDLKHEYQWTVSSPTAAWRNRVEIRPSRLVDPRNAAAMRDWLTGTGVRKAIESAAGSNGAVAEIVRDGRRLRHLTDPKSGEQIFIDPRTDRIVMVEIRRPEGGTERIRIDYPDAASIDRSRFRFTMPKGAVVVDRSGDPVRRLGGGEADGCAAQMRHLAQGLRRIVRDVGGEWPETLYPAVVEIIDDELLQCPLDPSGDRSHVSYRYHRPSGAVADGAITALNGIYAHEGRQPPPALTRTVLLECRHHPGIVIRLYGDGHTAKEATTAR